MSPLQHLTERREEEKERRRAEIIDAAEAVYAEVGWDAATIDAVARRARLSRALVYVYFKDKEDLHFAIVVRALEEMRKRFVEAAAGESTGLAQVEAIGRAYVRYAHDLPHYFDACSEFQAHRVSADDGAPNEHACLIAGRSVHAVLVGALNAGMADGSIRANLGDPLTTGIALWGFTHGLIQIASTKQDQLTELGVQIPKLTEQAFALLSASLANRGS